MPIKFFTRHLYSLGNRQQTRLLCLALTVFHYSSVFGVMPPKTETSRILMQPVGRVTATWKPIRAQVTENFHVVRTSLTIENISNHAVASAAFYGEYLDNKGRLCFTAVFDLSKNEKGQSGEVPPGGSRTLLAGNFDITFAVQPRTLKLYLLHQKDGPNSQHGDFKTQGVITPVTIRGVGRLVSEQWYKLCLGPEHFNVHGPVLDVAFGYADVNAEGRLLRFKALDALTTLPFVSWAQEFVTHLPFAPAHDGGRPITARTLLLFRAVTREWTEDDPAALARINPWVMKYVASLDNKQVPPINLLVLYPPQTQAGPFGANTLQRCFDYPGAGTDWSAGLGLLSFSGATGPRGE